MLDPDGHISTWNAGAERIKGYRPRRSSAGTSRLLQKEDVLAGKCEPSCGSPTREGRFEEEGWRVRKDGSRFWANVVITARQGRHGNCGGSPR